MNKNTKIIIGALCAVIVILVVIVIVVLTNKDNNVPTGQTNAKGEQIEYVSNNGKVEVVDSGWSVVTEYSDTEVYYAAEIENKNNKVAEFINIAVTGKDSEGKILFTDAGTVSDINYLFPGERVSFTGHEYWNKSEGTPAIIEFSVSVTKWSDALSFNYPKNTDLEVTNISKINKSGDTSKITGEVVNHSKTNIDSTLAVVVLKKDGKIVGGQSTYINDLKAEGKKAFEMYIYDIEFDSYEVSAQAEHVGY